MAITTGVGPHFSWAIINGTQIALEHGSVNLAATRKSSSFSGTIPMSTPGAEALSDLTGGNQTTIVVSTRGTQAPLVTGEIDEINFDYIGRTIKFSGRDLSAKLHETLSSDKWINQKGSDIVQDCIGRVGLTGNITPSDLQAGKQLQQDHVKLSDINSLSHIIAACAQLDGMRWFVDASGVFHYVPMASSVGSYSIFVNQAGEPISSDCLELQVRHNLQAGKTISTTVKSFHSKLKRVFSYTSTVPGSGGTRNYQHSIPTLTQENATKHAQSRSEEAARHEFTVTATVVGDPTVTAGMGLQLRGTPFDQTFNIDSVSHDFGMDGHLTHITARSAKEGREAT